MAKRTRKRQALRDLAKALTACERAGLHPRLKHEIAFTDYGYVLPIRDRWVVRRLNRR